LGGDTGAQRLAHVEERLEADTSTGVLVLERLDESESTVGEELSSISLSVSVSRGFTSSLNLVEALGVPGVGRSSEVKRNGVSSARVLPLKGVLSLSLIPSGFVLGRAFALIEGS
jgi:hypothetical protein